MKYRGTSEENRAAVRVAFRRAMAKWNEDDIRPLSGTPIVEVRERVSVKEGEHVVGAWVSCEIWVPVDKALPHYEERP